MAQVTPLELQKYLQEIDYPASKQNLITHAQQQGADEKVLSALSKFKDKTYSTPAEVSHTLIAL
ncbi:MAG TPA: DUF2795 domain-containing protein [Coleofasciculaceae cyanobacterium]